MRKALESLPGVEKDSIEIDTKTRRAAFRVNDPARFRPQDAISKIDEVGFSARVKEAGANIAAR